MSFSFYFAGFDIGSIRTHHETSTELSISSGDDTLASRCSHMFIHERFPGRGIKPSKSAPHMRVSFSCAGFDMGSITTRHETSAELLTSSRDHTLPSEEPILGSGPDTPILGKHVLKPKNGRSPAHVRVRSSSWAL